MDRILQNTNKAARLTYIACLQLMLSVLCFCTNQRETDDATVASNEEVVPVQQAEPAESSEESVPFMMADGMPKFKGEDPSAFAKWLNEKLVYPESAKEAGIQGEVIVSFTIDANGKLSDSKILSGLSDDIDKEVLRVVSSSPAWTPDTVEGKAAKCSFALPVVFNLKDKS